MKGLDIPFEEVAKSVLRRPPTLEEVEAMKSLFDWGLGRVLFPEEGA